MAVDRFCLKWNNFQTSIITAFESLQTTEDLVDVTLTCEGSSIKAHKIILSACSPYFRGIFKDNPCPHPIVILKDVLYIDLVAILNFMYHGEVLVTQDQLSSFLQTAELLQVSGLKAPTDLRHKSTQLPIKSSKSCKSKLLDSSDFVSKRIRTTHRVKQPKAAVTSAINVSDQTCESSSAAENFELVDKIKVEVDVFHEEHHDFNENIAEKPNQQSSILEAALEPKESQFSILERSLTLQSASGKSPSPLTYPMEHVVVVHETPDSPHSLTNTLDLTCENVQKSIKTEDESSRDVEIYSDSLQSTRNIPELQPHHSSQCGTCPHCGKIYSNQSALKYHVRLVHSDLTNMYCCHLCPESFDYREGYKKHMAEIHSIRS